MKRKLLVILFITFFSILSLFTYFSKVTGNIEDAESAFENYIGTQGIDKNDIKTKKIYKDYKFGGYDIEVTYKSEPSSYVYRYFYHAKTKEITLNVFDDGRNIEEGMKYPPIEG